MARIRTSTSGGITRVLVQGRLSAVDMGRLEQACAPALLANPTPLIINLSGVTTFDQTAIAVLSRVQARGAQIVGAAWLDDLRDS